MVINTNQQEDDEERFKIFEDPVKLGKILQSGIHAALLKHKQAGNPICVDKDGEVIWIPPDQILIETGQDPEKDSDNKA